ncbi:MAG: hypothetical protein HQ522_22870 [Bacteroidetes bacterium]|nr:hypothetical protein [Bacteroidota bacterium]
MWETNPRVSEYYGQKLEETEAKVIKEGAPVALVGDENDITYVMPDGSMLFTRENGWQEIKELMICSQQPFPGLGNLSKQYSIG